MFDFLIPKSIKIKKARLALIDSLDKGTIDYLLEQMASTEIYSPLLNKKREKETSNTDDISWYAYRRAEKLSLPIEKRQLLEKLNSATDDEKKKHIYFCLAHFCKNTNDRSLFNFLMDRLENEKDIASRRSILIGISTMRKSSDLYIQPLKKLVTMRNRDLKINSIIALQQTNDTEVEDLLLPIFIDTKDSHVKTVITWTLETSGTKKSVPYLEEAYKRTRDYGLRAYILKTIEKIKGKH
jgi:hypothetical protein